MGIDANSLAEWKSQFHSLLREFQLEAQLNEKKLLVIGCSTSEVAGERIGTDGSLEVAQMLYEELIAFQDATGVQIAFQCCEHVNRALVIPRKIAGNRGYEEVSVIPVRTAGGAMAAYAYNHMADAIVVEHIKADAGIDIGDTFIGMHLKHVAVPFRSTVKEIGHAHVTMAKTRPKLIGGVRAVYENGTDNESCT
ncbi:TIGR01440 family protein [Bacillus sp. V59.32b]|uniref:TIGR01440 family protein n=1 Tax=Bacillus sp. V59.32b TaxID=1758642 RepID=UPI000E3D486D|nr:TIGR01440 family protein [Bacillus sp. V59.32b]RFU64261.1 TIGR01440 family protein [Bacillus sp. V59.32b]